MAIIQLILSLIILGILYVRMIRRENETEQAIGIVIGLGAMVIMFVYQIKALIRLKKDTENYCRMEL